MEATYLKALAYYRAFRSKSVERIIDEGTGQGAFVGVGLEIQSHPSSQHPRSRLLP
ncbi:hypothetical protein DFAR_3070014 [Desulfarculales bacterium]